MPQTRLSAFFAVLFASVLVLFPARAQTFTVTSPDGANEVAFTLRDGVPYYTVARFGRPLVTPSRMGFVLKDAPPLDRNFTVAASAETSFDETWTQPWGEKKDIRNHYRELRIDLETRDEAPRRMAVVFRVFDDGVGFRYEWPEQPNLDAFEIMDEVTEFTLAGDPDAWWIPAFRRNRYEYRYTKSPTTAIDTVHTPVTFETADGLFMSLHEAALTDFASMTLRRTGGTTLKADLVPWSDGVKVKARTPHVSPWRTLQIADDAGGLITSYLILNLNEPNKLGDVSWVKPGKYVGIWWEMHLGLKTWASGPKHGATTERAKQYIDFAARHGFDGVLVEGWNVGWDGDWTKNGDKFRFTTPYPDFDIEALSRYAAERGVSLIGHHETGAGVENYERQMEDAFAYYEKLGVHAVKTGYVGWGNTSIFRTGADGKKHGEWHHGQYMVRHYRKVVETAARHHLMLDVHEPIKDTGIRRTYPNMMTREGARGQEYNATWGDGNTPAYTAILPFTRLLAGPFDFTPGIFHLEDDGTEPMNKVPTTLAKQLALYVVLFSPLQMAADLPENYEEHPDAFRFIEDVPTDWEDTRVLHARIGDYVTIVRKERGGEDWFLGSLTDEWGRVLRAPLSFLDPGRKYVAEIYRDGPKADWRTNRMDIEITKALVDQATVFTLRLAPGGGQAVRFRPATDEEARSLPAYRE